MMLAESKSPRFLDKPPSWFATCCWFYSLIWAGFGGLAMLLATSFGMHSTKAYALLLLFGFPLPLLVIVIFSGWVRNRILLMVPLWWVVIATCMGITQGAMSACISKAFSAVTH
ncbi:MAG: hypothetical protein IPL73_00740 [Candidatus Obscuribacter sp.]|nr:hypothetical protein [Candidatus Obscuribacter sp.]